MSESIRILQKHQNNEPNVELLVICGYQIYYLNVNLKPKMWIISQVFLLAEIPNLVELNQRLQFYIKNEYYHQLNVQQTASYLKKIYFFLSPFFNELTQTELKLFPDMYIQNKYHPDLTGLYQCLSH